MEWQANYFASCLLLPREPFIREFFDLRTNSTFVIEGLASCLLMNNSQTYKTFIS